MVEITESTNESERQEKIKEVKGLVKKIFGFPFVVTNIGMSFYVSSNPIVSAFKVRIEGEPLRGNFDYGIYVSKEKYLDKSMELAELFESHYQGKKACVIKELPFK